MNRRCFAAISTGCFAILATTVPAPFGDGTAQVGWGLQQLFGGSAVEATVAGAPVGDAVKSYVEDNASSWSSIVGENAGAFMDDLMGEVGVLDPVIITAETSATITAGAAAEAGAVIGADVGTMVAPIVGTLIGAAVGLL